MDLVHIGGRSPRSDYDDSPRSPRRSRKNSRIVPPHAPDVPGDDEPTSPPRRMMRRQRSGYRARERDSDWDRRQDDEFLQSTPESRASSSSYHPSRPRYYDSGSRRDQSTTPSHSIVSSMTSVATPHPPRSSVTRQAPAVYRRPSTSIREPSAHVYDEEEFYERPRSRSRSRPTCVMPTVPTPPQSRRASRSRAPSYAPSLSDSEDDHTEEARGSEDERRSPRSRRDTQLVRINRDTRSRSRAASIRRDDYYSERRGMSVGRNVEEDREEADFRDYPSQDERLRERISSRQPSRGPSRPASRAPSRPASIRHVLMGGDHEHEHEHDADSEEPPLRDRRDQIERRESHKDRHSSRTSRDHRRNRSESHSKRSPPSKRSSSKRYYESEERTVEKRDKYHPPSSSLRRSKTISVSGSAAASQQQRVSSSRRPKFLGSFFGSSHNGASHHHIPATPPKLYECVICLDERPSRKLAKLKCGHRMCNSCLRRLFSLSTSDPQHMPPKCCSTDHIPLKHVEQLFDMPFKKNWNKKFNEYSARNRVYCPKRSCGEFIRPEDISRGRDGKKVGKCSKCSTKVCVQCGGKSHTGRDCPKDEETVRFLAQAKDAGWQRCVKCKAMIELDEGCNHMTCRCGAEFCYVCGARWKSCECPWFNYETVEADRLQHMQVPSPLPPRPTLNIPPLTPPRESGSRRARPPPYDEDRRFRHDHHQLDQHDARMARHLQDWREGDRDDDFREGFGDMTALGNAAGHFMNEDFRLRPPHPPPPPPPPPVAGPHAVAVDHPPPPVAGDYVHGVNRARGVRANSMTRLAERFVARPPPPPPPMPTAATMPLPQQAHAHPTHSNMPPALAPGPQIRRHTVETTPSGRVNVNVHARPMVYTAEPEDLMMMTPAVGGMYTTTVKTVPVVRKQHVRELPKSGPVASAQAGLSKGGSYGGRVQEWLMHVGEGRPESTAEIHV